jgi:hypothetical protein
MDSKFKLDETGSNQQKLTDLFTNFKDAFTNDPALLKLKKDIKNFGVGSWRPGLALEASSRLEEMKKDASPEQESKMTLDRAKVVVMQERIKSLEQDIIALLSGPDEKHVFSTGIFSGVKYQRMCEIAGNWNDPKDEVRMFLRDNITSLQSDFPFVLEDIQELRGLQREVDPIDVSAESLVDLVQREWFLVESLHKRVVYIDSSFNKVNEAEVQKLT